MNIALAVLAIAAAFITGWSIVRIFWPPVFHGAGVSPAVPVFRRIVSVREYTSALIIRICLAWGVGQVVAAVHYLLWRSVSTNIGVLYKLTDCALIPMVAWLAARAWRIKSPPALSIALSEISPSRSLRLSTSILFGITVLVASMAICIYLARSCFEPLGAWDAWAIWNLKARFMFRGGADWTGMFSGYIWFSHPDYPLLIPASVARLWTHLGLETTVVPQFIGMAFTTMVVGLLFASLAWLRGLVHACVAVLLLVSFEPYLTFGGAQMSDIPLSFYVLTAFVILAVAGRIEHNRGRLLVLAGVLVGCALITKNEAQPITLSLLIAMTLTGWFEVPPSGGSVNRLKTVFRTRLLPLLFGTVPFVLVLVAQKLLFAGSSYLLADQPSTQAFLQKIVHMGRHKTIIEFVVTWNFAQPSFLLLLALPLACGLRTDPKDRFAAFTGIVTVTLTFVIYYVVFLVMPYDLRNLLESFPRVQLHFWPALIFTVLLATPLSGANDSQTPRFEPHISTCSRGQ